MKYHRFTGLTGQRRPTHRTPPASRPCVEALEDRCLLSFNPPVSYAVGANPNAVVTADFNNDGRLDLATANAGDNTVSVLPGNAKGTFQAAQTSSTGSSPVSVAVGDFNRDGKLDLATANAGGYDVSILLGNGDGTFQAPSNIGIGSSPNSVAVGDFNRDGKLDLGVTSNEYIPGFWGGYYGNYWYAGQWEGRTHVLLGVGDGSFSGPNTTYLDAGYHYAAVAADLNGDGFDDFVTNNADYGYVNVLLADNTGSLQFYSGFATAYYSSAAAAGDLNGDGHTDLVTTSYNNVSVLLGDGAGGFAAFQSYTTGSGGSSVVLGDFTGDGALDVATPNYADNNVRVLRGLGNGSFSMTESFAAGPGSYAVAAGDFNGDGWLDAATADANGNTASVLINDQSWPFVPPKVSVSDATVTEGNTATVNATFTLTLTYASPVDVTVHYETADISAAAGSDYTAASQDVVIPAGQTSGTFTVAVQGDRIAEPTETFAVNLTAASNATIDRSQGTGTILDDEPRVSINDVSATEGNTGTRPGTFSVSLSAAYDVPVTISYATAPGTATAGSDYQTTSSTLTIPAGKTSGTISVLVNGDRLPEPNETYFVNLSNLSYGAITDDQGVGTIVDDEPRISINDVSKAEGRKGKTTQFTFTITLSVAYDQAVTVSYRTVNGTATTSNSDYAAKTGTLTFKPGETTKTITIDVKGDRTREANETFYVDLFGNSSNSQLSKNRGIGTILNDD
jgi:hypothetical protein